MRIHHLATGGTIDSHWDASQDTAVPNEESIVGRYFTEAVRYRGIVSETLFLKDSRQMTAKDQDYVGDKVAETAHNRILVTSGTFLMPDIGRVIKGHPMTKHFEKLDRRVVLTGALIPLQGYLRSDGGFNLGMSTAMLEEDTIDRVSVVMNGSCFKLDRLRKDLTSATFSDSAGEDQIPKDSFDLITAGGSMDFQVDGMDRLVPGPHSEVPEYLRRSVKISRHFHSVNPFVKDSRALELKDYETIAAMIEGARTNDVLITTGIYKMSNLRRFIEEKLLPGNRKRIIITGARLPLGVTDATDATFNLGYSLGRLPFLKPGVYTSLNGKIFEGEEDKNILEHVFSAEEIRVIHEQSKAFEKTKTA